MKYLCMCVCHRWMCTRCPEDAFSLTQLNSTRLTSHQIYSLFHCRQFPWRNNSMELNVMLPVIIFISFRRLWQQDEKKNRKHKVKAEMWKSQFIHMNINFHCFMTIAAVFSIQCFKHTQWEVKLSFLNI